MSKDVKIEVLYYKTQADVSLEFGLHGNYPLRLLSSGCNDIGSFFRSLKRAVSRSEIIITVGGYGDDDLPGFIARAVGKNCVMPDYRKAGIITETKYFLPEGAVPLSPKRRHFSGFLIECGPQTIISLVDDKKLRLETVQQFLVNYITEHNNVFNNPFTEAPVKNDPSFNESIEASNISAQDELSDTSSKTTAIDEVIITESEISESESEFESAPESESELEPESESETAVESSDSTSDITAAESDITLKDEVTSDIECETEPEHSPSTDLLTFAPDELLFEDDDVDSRYKTRNKRRIVRALCLILSLVCIAAVSACLWLFPAAERGNTKTADYYAQLRSVYTSAGDDLSAAFDRVRAQNSGFFTWLSVPQTGIDHPVLTVHDSYDAKHYLSTLPDGTINAAGTLYSSTGVSPNISEKNTFIYGNSAEGGIFEDLKLITAEPSKSVGTFVTTSDSRFQSTWQVFSVFKGSDAHNFNYTQTEFASRDEYIAYLEQLRDLCSETIDSDFRYKDKILILIGISDEEQYCVAAKLSGVRIISSSIPVANVSSGVTSSDTNSDGTTSSDISQSEPEGEDFDNDYNGETPDIVLPPIIDVPSSSNSTTTPSVSSSVTSSGTSENASSEITSSTPSVTTSSETVSSTPSQSVGTSSVQSSTSSSPASSADTPVKPDIDPMYTWDITLHVIDSSTGIRYSASAVNIIAMIIEDEMSPTIDPKDALIAQSIAAYNWLLNNGATKESTAPRVALDPNPYPQAFECANLAKGSVLLYGNTVARTNYYAYSAGKTACTQDIWGGTAFPYLQSVDCPVDEELKDFITVSTYSSAQIQQLINDKCGIDVSGMDKSEWLKPVKYDANGLYCLTINIGGKEYKGRYLRENLLTKANTGIATIRSAAYTVSYNEETDKFTVSCKGYGHGVGMSQRGAKAYAKLGWTYDQILAHFFPGTTLVKN